MDPFLCNLNCIEVSLSTLEEHVSELEQRVGANDGNVKDLPTRVKKLEEDNSCLLDKAEDLENRSRFSNLRFVRISKSVEGRDMLGFMAGLIPQPLGQDNFLNLLTIEGARLTPTSRHNDRSSSRPILI